MTYFVMAAMVPEGCQLLSVDAHSRKEAIIYAEKEIRKYNKLPPNYTVLPRVLTDVPTEKEAKDFMDALTRAINSKIEKEDNA